MAGGFHWIIPLEFKIAFVARVTSKFPSALCDGEEGGEDGKKGKNMNWERNKKEETYNRSGNQMVTHTILSFLNSVKLVFEKLFGKDTFFLLHFFTIVPSVLPSSFRSHQLLQGGNVSFMEKDSNFKQWIAVRFQLIETYIGKRSRFKRTQKRDG